MFEVINTSEYARTGLLKLRHGSIQTPAFMPVGTNGTVKGLTAEDLNETGSEVILGNTFHLMLRPGDELIKNIGLKFDLSNDQMDDCLKSEAAQDEILDQRIDAQKKYKIESTPTILVNEKKYSGKMNYKNF